LNKACCKTFTLIAVLCTSAVFTNLALAGEKIVQTLVVPPQGKLFVDITRGFVKIQGWDKNEISIQGELDDSVKKLIFKNKGIKSLIKAVSKGEEHWGDSSVLKIFMPHQTKLYFKGVDTTFALSKLHSGIDGRTMKGDLVVEKSNSNIMLSSVSGSIYLVDSTGTANIETVNGAIDVDGQYEKIELESMSGDISARIANIDLLKLKNISGNTHIEGDVKADAFIKIESVSGDILYQASKELNAECEFASQFGGEITNELTADVAQQSAFKGQMLHFVSGDGSGKLIMKSITGTITLNQGEH